MSRLTIGVVLIPGGMEEKDTNTLATPEQRALLLELKAKLEMKILSVLAHSAVPEEFKNILRDNSSCK